MPLRAERTFELDDIAFEKSMLVRRHVVGFGGRGKSF